MNSILIDDNTAIWLNHNLCLTILAYFQGLLYRSVELLTLFLWLVGKIFHSLASEHRQIEGQGERLVCSIQTTDNPFSVIDCCTRAVLLRRLTGYNRILRRISCDKLHIVPCCRQALQPVQFPLRNILKIVRIETNTVYAALIGDSGCHLEDITCIALMAALV